MIQQTATEYLPKEMKSLSWRDLHPMFIAA